MEEVKREEENRTVIAIMLFVLGILALGLSIYLFTYWEYGIVYDEIFDVPYPVGVEKVYPLQWIGVITACVGAILVVAGILKAKS